MKNKEYFINRVKDFGLTEEESIVFVNLIEKLKPLKKQLNHINKEYNKSLPFEGGYMTDEILTILSNTFNPQ